MRQIRGTDAQGLVDGVTRESTRAAGEILERLHSAAGTRSDSHLSVLLGLARSSISTARARGVVPSAWLVNAANLFRVSADRLIFGGVREFPEKKDSRENHGSPETAFPAETSRGSRGRGREPEAPYPSGAEDGRYFSGESRVSEMEPGGISGEEMFKDGVFQGGGREGGEDPPFPIRPAGGGAGKSAENIGGERPAGRMEGAFSASFSETDPLYLPEGEFLELFEEFRTGSWAVKGWVQVEILRRFPEFADFLKKRGF
ncbi:MAG: helix-turn-helix domain containing protein [Deltaproteobacteria bacterium]|jgi:hypothetical protein|nr:helix-turn-helix domain containing protein [Deltaproteobacteria bacterium]